MEEDAAFFVLGADALGMGEGGGAGSFEYSLVQIPGEKIERALWMQDGIDAESGKLSELRGQIEHNFGSEVNDEILKLGAKISKMRMERNDYLAQNAISYMKVIERGRQTFFEGDGIAANALEGMLRKGVLELGRENDPLMRV